MIRAKTKKGLHFIAVPYYCWRPQGDLNPCYRRESWKDDKFTNR